QDWWGEHPRARHRTAGRFGAMHKGKDTSVTVMRLLRWLIVGAGLSLLALSISLHYRIDARFDIRAPPAASSTASGGTIQVEQFGLKQTFAVKVFDTRSEAERTCGRGNIMRWEEISPKESKGGPYGCRSDLR